MSAPQDICDRLHRNLMARIKEFMDECQWAGCDNGEGVASLVESCRDEIERLRAAEPRWIPVSERLPEWGVPVIGWFPGAAQSFECKLNEHDGVWSDSETGIHLHEHSRPTHWMPLPAPPETIK